MFRKPQKNIHRSNKRTKARLNYNMTEIVIIKVLFVIRLALKQEAVIIFTIYKHLEAILSLSEKLIIANRCSPCELAMLRKV